MTPEEYVNQFRERHLSGRDFPHITRVGRLLFGTKEFTTAHEAVIREACNYYGPYEDTYEQAVSEMYMLYPSSETSKVIVETMKSIEQFRKTKHNMWGDTAIKCLSHMYEIKEYSTVLDLRGNKEGKNHD